jgi:HSP20 family protein
MADKNAQNTSLARTGNAPSTGMTRWSPWDEFTSLRRQMDDFFTRAFGYTPLSQMIPSELRGSEPDIDIHETQDRVIVFAALPGYSPEQINAEATTDSIMISGERASLHEDNENQGRSRRVTGASRFSISYSLPAEVDPNRVSANFQNGVLRIEMPKTERAQNKGVKINVQSEQPGSQGTKK